MTTAEDLQKQLDAQQVQLNSMQDILQRAFNISEDALKTLMNAKSIGGNGKLGGLSAADTLSGAPMGDAVALRNSLGLSSLATETVFDTGDVSKFDWGPKPASIGCVTALRNATYTEWGWNDNGLWWKHPDGTLICTNGNVPNSNGNRFTKWSFPYSFSDTPTVTCTQRWTDGDDWNGLTTIIAPTAGGVTIYGYTGFDGSLSTTARHYSCLAVGRWK